MKQNIKKRGSIKVCYGNSNYQPSVQTKKIKNYDLRLSNTKILKQDILYQKRLIKKC